MCVHRLKVYSCAVIVLFTDGGTWDSRGGARYDAVTDLGNWMRSKQEKWSAHTEGARAREWERERGGQRGQPEVRAWLSSVSEGRVETVSSAHLGEILASNIL